LKRVDDAYLAGEIYTL